MPDKLQIQNNFPLADLTTFKIGGDARFFLRAETEEDVFNALEFADRRGLEVFVLGGGSNILISDRGFDGMVLQVALRGISVLEQNAGDIKVVAAAGEDWDEFVGYCVARDLAGIECLSGIPGLVGGTPIQNVGAYGQEVSDCIVSVRVLDRNTRRLATIDRAGCGFEYRKSIFNTDQKDQYVVLSVTYELKKGGQPKIVYADLKTRFKDKKPTLSETRQAVCEIRRSKGMLVRQGGPDSRSAGSFFKNPVVSMEEFERINLTASTEKLGKIPGYPFGIQKVKVPAAWLIEHSGFGKGYRSGNAGLSMKHTLALTNRGNAAAQDILDLKETIQAGVREKFNIELVPEPSLIGF